MKTRISYFFILFFLTFYFGIAQQELPPVHNFNIKEYRAGNQNWSICESNDYLYVANNEGLLEFDGLEWRLYQLPNKTIIRSVAVKGHKIFTGSYEEFGYWERSKNGELIYTSLVSGLNKKDIETESIWGVYPGKDRVIFKSFAKIYIYQNNKTEVLTPGATLHGALLHKDDFYVFMAGKGIFRLNESSFEIVEGSEILKDYSVQSIIPYGEKELMIGTSLNGCFISYQQGIKKWEHPVNEILKEHQLNNIIHDKEKLIFGTIKHGLYVLNEKDNSYYNLHVNNGLQNNTILASTVDNNGVLWVALDNGVSAVPVNYSAYYLNPTSQNIGAVYDVATLNNETYLATNTGIYRIDAKGVEFVKGSQGHTWDLYVVEDEIICGHNLVTYSIKDDILTEISGLNGGYIFLPLPENNGTFIQGNYSGISLYKKESGNWVSERIPEINFPVKQIVFEQRHILWIAHAYKGIYRLHLSEDYKSVEKIEAFQDNTLLNLYDIRLFKIENDIAFFSNEKWFVYNSIEQKIEPFVSLNSILGSYKAAYPISDTDYKPFVFKHNNGTVFFRNELQDSIQQVFIPNRYYKDLLVNKNEKAIVVNDSLTYILLYNDVLAVNPKKINNGSEIQPPRIERIFINGKPQDLGTELSFRSKDTLTIEVSMPFLSNNTIAYKLSGEDENWKPSSGKIVFYNLPFGDEELNLKTLTASLNSSGNNTKLKFYVKPPWYAGIYGIIFFLLLALIVVFVIVTINKYVLIRHKKYLEEQYTHQQELLRKEEALNHEKKLNEFQKKQYLRELNAKTKELANTAMTMTKKNELLLKLKSDLLEFKNEVLSKNKFNRLLSNIDKNIDNVKDWEVFESNFNQIHESFFKNLVERHPDVLTPKDLRLCAYLKLNLSTKEISPLMSISSRGVEIHRYRLRKKLNLDKNQNLNEYFMNIS